MDREEAADAEEAAPAANGAKEVLEVRCGAVGQVSGSTEWLNQQGSRQR